MEEFSFRNFFFEKKFYVFLGLFMCFFYRACGARIVNRTDELREEDVGTEAGLFNIEKIGDEYWTYVTGCKNPKACTILLRGGSKDLLNEVERNMHDAMNVARNVILEPKIVPGGGAVEMAISQVRTSLFPLSR